MAIPQEIIDEVRQRADIAEVVARFVDLRRSGTSFKAICPFHEEKTPSFIVSSDKQIWHCFGCGRGGNVFSFLMEIEGVSFPEAVRSLGRQYGVAVPDRPQRGETESRHEALYRVNDFAARWYNQQLAAGKTGGKARKYLRGRGIPESAWRSFQLGYAGDRWDAFAVAARRKGVPLDDLRELKLVIPREKSAGHYDYFRNRLMFPIAALSGRIVGFGGRALGPDTEPKYLNSVDSAVYAKRRTLYGLTQARDAVRAERAVILVEGYTDCISLHVNGFQNVIASCGTAITPDHASLIRRISRRVILMPDADPAGMGAALAAGSVFLGAGLDVSVVRLPDGTDPDSAVRSMGRDEIAKNAARALEYFQYVDYIMKSRPMSPREKETLIQRVTSGLSGADDPLRYEVLLQDLARVLGINPEALQRRRSAAVRDRRRPHEGPQAVRRAELEKTLLRLLMEGTPEAAEAREKLDVDDFSQSGTRSFYKLLDSAWENHIDIRSQAFQQNAEAAGLEGFAAEISLIPIPPGNPGKLLKDTVRRVKELQIRDELNVLREKLLELPEESEDAVAVAEHYARLKRALSEL